MPSDPVKAVFWFFHWSLQVLVRFFWILILAAVFYGSFVNCLVWGIVTFLVGLSVWFGIALTLFVFNICANVSRTVAVGRKMAQKVSGRRAVCLLSVSG